MKKIIKSEEIHLLICAQNLEEATNLAQDFPMTTYVGKHTNNRNHFFFSLKVSPNKYKSIIEETSKDTLNWAINNVIMFKGIPEDKNYYPKVRNHCQDCRSRH